MPVSQPTILVKKKDGTSVRMTMEDFKAYVRNTKATKTRNEYTENLPMKEPEVILPATSAPVSEIFVDEAAYVRNTKATKLRNEEFKNEDVKSLLEERVEGARKQEVVRTVLPAGREDAFDSVIGKLKFPVSDELRPRLKSLIVSRVKDVRSDDQVAEYATRPVGVGGLNWTLGQVEELLRVLKMHMTHDPNSMAHKNIQDTRDKQIPNSKFQIPNNTKTQNTNNITQIPNKYPISNIQYSGNEKPILQDIVPPVVEEKRGVGPTDEMATISLLEFRRLSPKPDESAKILSEKFENFKKESLLLYLRAVQGWRESPLYLQYQSIISTAVNRKIKIQSMFTGGKDGLTTEEFRAITELNRTVNI